MALIAAIPALIVYIILTGLGESRKLVLGSVVFTFAFALAIIVAWSWDGSTLLHRLWGL